MPKVTKVLSTVLLLLLLLLQSSGGGSITDRPSAPPPPAGGGVVVSGRTVTYRTARFTVLSSAAICLEQSPNARFVDAPSTTFVHRAPAGPTPEFRAVASASAGGGGLLTITTAQLTLRWNPTFRFSAGSLNITLAPRP
eukprot:SAG25_NODE_5578_length_642_cov_1.084715_2_plen_138_part_01